MSSLNITLENGIDGELFAAQRALVLELSASNLLGAEHQKLLTGLTNLLDEIADQAHDRYGVKCLLEGRNFPVDLTGHVRRVLADEFAGDRSLPKKRAEIIRRVVKALAGEGPRKTRR